MGGQKKHGKGRLDKWYHLAKERGYRARSAFKLVQLNKKYGFLQKSRVLIDLCAAPGGWCQVAAETMPKNSLIVGVDLDPIKPIPKVITFQSDITTDKCRATLRQHLKTWKADTVLHDGAPNVGTAWAQDSFNQVELALQSLKLATDFLIAGGTFVTKVFRSKDYNAFLWVMKQLFTKVEATKPPSSRNVSAEIFVVCTGYKAPKYIDPRLLDAESVFSELPTPAPNNEAKVYRPEVKKRQREGYEEGNYTLYKEAPASEFITTTDPLEILAQYNKITFPQGDESDKLSATLTEMEETSIEVRLLCNDLKVLNNKQFKLLLKWRLNVREKLGFSTKKTDAKPMFEEVTQVDSMDEEMKMQEELQELNDKANSKKKREKRKDNERKQKEIVRMQLNMTTPMEIGMEQSDGGTMFGLKRLDKTPALQRIARGKMAMLKPSEEKAKEKAQPEAPAPEAAESEAESEDSDLAEELDQLYDEYQERRSEADAKYRAKKARARVDGDDWEGIQSGDEDDEAEDSDGELEEEESSSDDDDDDDEEEEEKRPNGKSKKTKSLLTDLDNEPATTNGLSKRAQNFFSQDIFQLVPGILEAPKKDEDEDSEEEEEEEEEEADGFEDSSDDDMPDAPAPKKNGVNGVNGKRSADVFSDSEDDAGGFEVVKRQKGDDWEEEERLRKANGRIDYDIITAEAMTMAHDLVTGRKSKDDLVDEHSNRQVFYDNGFAPQWFLDDEAQHSKPHRPVTKEAVEAIKMKLRALDARPIKKVREAKARKKFKAAQRLEKLKKKSELLIASEDLTEKEKAEKISRIMSRAGKKKPHNPTKVVVARGANRGIKGRPKGVKGRYKLVDPRMKKETRALRRIAKKHK